MYIIPKKFLRSFLAAPAADEMVRALAARLDHLEAAFAEEQKHNAAEIARLTEALENRPVRQRGQRHSWATLVSMAEAGARREQ